MSLRFAFSCWYEYIYFNLREIICNNNKSNYYDQKLCIVYHTSVLVNRKKSRTSRFVLESWQVLQSVKSSNHIYIIGVHTNYVIIIIF